MICAIGDDDAAIACHKAAGSDRKVVGFAAGADEEHCVERLREQRGEALGVGREPAIEKPAVRVECAQLAGGGGDDIRLAVSDMGDVVDAVEVRLRVFVDELEILRADHQRRLEKDPPVADRLIASLGREFAGALKLLEGGRHRTGDRERGDTRRCEGIGKKREDGVIVGQTLTNDYGRPYGEGLNSVTGITGWASSGPFTVYLRGEYQHAAAGPELPLAARQFIANTDFGLPLPPAPVSLVWPAWNLLSMTHHLVPIVAPSWCETAPAIAA